MGGVADAVSGAFDFAGDVLSAPGDWIGQGAEWLGERTGITPLNNFGEWLSDDKNKWAQILANPLAWYYAPEMLSSSLIPEGMFFGGESMLPGLGSFGANELATWGAGAGEGLGGSMLTELSSGLPGLSPMTQSASSFLGMSPSTWGMLGLGGANIASQYYGAEQQQKMARENFDRQLSAWRENAFPSQSAVGAATNVGKQQINRTALTSKKALGQTLAARGLGSGSGELAGEYGNIERNKIENMGELATKMAQFGLTPYSAPPVTGLQPTVSFGERMANQIGGITGSLAGEYAKSRYQPTNYMNEYYKKLLGMG